MLDWKSDTRLVIDGTDFVLAPTDLRSAQAALDEGALLLRKPRWMVEEYAALQKAVNPRNVFEVGIYAGGSTAFVALLFRPRRLVAIDLNPSRVPALDDFVEANALHETVQAHFGVDQADRERLEEIVAQEFGSEPLDLVIDDASHLLEQTRASFNVLFPRLRPGGLFVLEDWSWQHVVERNVLRKLQSDEQAREALARRIEARGGPPPSEEPLSRLALELVLASGCAEGVVAEVTSVRRGWLVARRGDATLDPSEFDISQCYGKLGRSLLVEPTASSA